MGADFNKQCLETDINHGMLALLIAKHYRFFHLYIVQERIYLNSPEASAISGLVAFIISNHYHVSNGI